MTRRKDDHAAGHGVGPVKATEGPKPRTDLLGTLGLLRERRAPYAELLAAIVAETLDRLPPASNPANDADSAVIAEIGAGTGQLREWLPLGLRAAWGDRLVHTDPSEPALRLLRDRAPQAKTRVAAAEQLPFADGSCGAVLGLCVFDAVEDEARVVAELARVLCPGGRFVHFMDMATLLEAPFAKLAASALVPLPNVFGDPGDSEWPLDIVLVRRDWLAGLLKLATQAAHPLVSDFKEYFGAFLADPFDATKATNTFKAVASSGERRSFLATHLESASRAAHQQGYAAIAPLPFHSGQYLRSVLETAVRDSGIFRIEQSAIVTGSSWVPRSGTGRGTGTGTGTGTRAPAYRSLCLGHQRSSDQLPRRLLTESAKVRVAPGGPPPDETLVEVGVFVFVAQRV